MTLHSVSPSLLLCILSTAFVLGPSACSSDNDATSDGDGDGDADGDGDGDGDGDSDGDTDGDGDADDELPPIHEPTGPWNECSDEDEPDGVTIVTAHDGVHQFFTDWEEGQNMRIVDAVADFPAEGPWRRIFLRLDLDCPEDGICDFWDRGAAISLVENAGSDEERPIELLRHMTPYGIGMCMIADVTDLASRLRGETTIRSFIDTWVGPGHAQGDGWRVTTTFIMHPGEPDAEAFASELLPLWNNNAEDRITEVGDPDRALVDELPQRRVTIPSEAQRVALQFLVTGHGQGNLYNCAEFCRMQHTITVGDQRFTLEPWRDDCADNPLSGQRGNWQYPRAGWCPGALVLSEHVDITDAVTPGEETTFSYALTDSRGDDYVNTCRPGAGGDSNTCTGCEFNSSAGNCDWDWSMHTPPYFRIAVQVLFYSS